MAHKNIVVMLSGKQGSGKTTLANGLAAWAIGDDRMWTYVLKFADTLYQMHDAIFSILEKEGIPRPEKIDGNLLQMLGTDWGRKTVHPDLWVRILQNKVHKVIQFAKWPKHKFIIIDDAREVNEINCFDTCSHIEVIKIRLECNEGQRKARAEKWRANTAHPSEVGLDDYNKFNHIIFTDTHNALHTLTLARSIIEARL